jgi:hypothetical protein
MFQVEEELDTPEKASRLTCRRSAAFVKRGMIPLVDWPLSLKERSKEKVFFVLDTALLRKSIYKLLAATEMTGLTAFQYKLGRQTRQWHPNTPLVPVAGRPVLIIHRMMVRYPLTTVA